jgi:hypothetical protein
MSELQDVAPKPNRTRIRRPEKSPLPRRQEDPPRGITQLNLHRRKKSDVSRIGEGDLPHTQLDQALTRTILKCSVLYEDWGDDVSERYASARSRKTELLQELDELARGSHLPPSGKIFRRTPAPLLLLCLWVTELGSVGAPPGFDRAETNQRQGSHAPPSRSTSLRGALDPGNESLRTVVFVGDSCLFSPA